MSSVSQINKAGKKAGLQIWRIENMEMVPIQVENHGIFYTGDSYILLQTREKEPGKSISWDLHFWLGNESTQDERGAAAILTSQIDDHLGGFPVQYREIQNSESSTFRGYFKRGIIYKKGGVESGFKHVKTNQSDVKRLLHVKGSRTVRATEVEMSWKSFNKGDIFILEVGNNIFQWNGSKSNRYERLKACQLVNTIKNDEKGGKGKITMIDEGHSIPTIMSRELSGSVSDINPEIADEEESKSDKLRKAAELYHVSSDTGKLIVKKVASAPFNQDTLLSGDCYILDNGKDKMIFVWKGKLASKDERSGALQNALQFIEEKNYHPDTKVQIMAENAESVIFTQFFKDWKKKDQTIGFGKAYSINKLAKIDKKKFDVKALFKAPKLAAQQGMVDDGSGKVEIWRVEGNKMVSVEAKDFGKFYSGDCYIILYTYIPKSRDEYIIYYWQGLNSTKDEIVASAYFAKELDDRYGGRPVQCRVVQGKEPMHLINIFDHPLIITSGGYSKAAGKNVGVSSKALYQVRSTAAGGTKLIQVDTSASMLNSNDAFLLKDGSNGFIWIGVGASDDEVKAARYGADILDVTTTIDLKEGSETDEFWTMLGGKKPYANSPRLQQDLELNPPKLFVISNAKGKVIVEEVPGEFTQSDLESDDVMMLDVWDQIFIWIGDGANEEEKQGAVTLVNDYIIEDPKKRDPDCPVITIKMNSEPVTFTGFFPSWDVNFFNNRKSFADRMEDLTSYKQ